MLACMPRLASHWSAASGSLVVPAHDVDDAKTIHVRWGVPGDDEMLLEACAVSEIPRCNAGATMACLMTRSLDAKLYE